MTLLDDAVTQAKDDTWTFQCPVSDGTCVPPGERPFHSTGWPTKKAATARGAQHLAEHKGEGVMQPLHEFREDQGLVANNDGTVSAKEL